MIRLAFCLFLIFGGAAAMAKDGSVQVPKRPEQPRTADEEFFASEEGRDIEQRMERVRKGEIDLQTAIREYRQKWHNGKPPVLDNDPAPLGPTIPNRW